MPEEPEKHVSAEAAAAQLASVVAAQVGIMGGILGCCQGLLILIIGFLVGLFLFWHPKEKDQVPEKNRPENHADR